jgi:hypothetical protein
MQLALRLGIVEFLQRETYAPDRRLLVLTAAPGTANAPIPAAIEAAVGSTGRRKRLVPVVSYLEDNPPELKRAAKLRVEGRAK